MKFTIVDTESGAAIQAQADPETATAAPPITPDLLVARNKASARASKSIRDAVSLRQYAGKCPPDAPDNNLHSHSAFRHSASISKTTQTSVMPVPVVQLNIFNVGKAMRAANLISTSLHSTLRNQAAMSDPGTRQDRPVSLIARLVSFSELSPFVSTLIAYFS